MSRYRACVIGDDGQITHSRTFACGSDADAAIWARHTADNDIELWCGDRFVSSLRLRLTDQRGAISHDVVEGRLVPKPAK
jgi:hypothetical protein